MEFMILNNEAGRWLLAAGAASAAFAILVVLKHRAAALLDRIKDRSATQIDDLLAHLIKDTRWPVLLLVALGGASFLLELGDRTRNAIQAVIFLGLLVQGAFWGNTIISVLVQRYRTGKLEHDAAGAMTAGIIEFIARATFFSVLFLVALDNLGFDITTLVASLGIGGVAVALAVQNILSDLFASLSIALDKPFVIGDFIIVGEFMGEVERVGLKTTRVRSLSGEQLVFANGDLLKSRIQNFKRMYKRRVIFKFGVVYQTTYEQLKEIPERVKAIITSTEKTTFDRAHFARYGDSSLDFEVVYFVLAPEYGLYMDIQQHINLELFRQFAEKGIQFAYPTRTLYIEGGFPASRPG